LDLLMYTVTAVFAGFSKINVLLLHVQLALDLGLSQIQRLARL
jgi:hypothetical protein